MRVYQLRRILNKGRKFNCAKCPIPQRTCSAISKGLWGEERCLLLVVLLEILVFHTEEQQRRRAREYRGDNCGRQAHTDGHERG